MEYYSSAKAKRGYVSATDVKGAAKMGAATVVKNSSNVFYGPDDKPAKVGSVDGEEIVVVLESEDPGADNYYLIEYNTTSGRKRGYVKQADIRIPSRKVTRMGGTKALAACGADASQNAYFGPNTTFPKVGSIGAGEIVFLMEQSDVSGSFKYIQYDTSSGYKRGYVNAAFTEMEPLNHRTADAGDVYYGPDMKNYAKAGSVENNEAVTVLWREGDWCYIRYKAKAKLKQGYVPKVMIADADSISVNGTQPDYSKGAYAQSSEKVEVLTGPGAQYKEAGKVYAQEGVTYLGFTAGEYSFIEYATSSGTKRGYILSSKLSAANKPSSCIARVTAEKSPSYIGPDSSYFKTGGVYKDELVILLSGDKDGDTPYPQKWSFIEYNTSAGRKRGYVYSEDIEPLGDVPANSNGTKSALKTISTALTGDLAVQYGPGAGYPKAGTVSPGERVCALTGYTYDGYTYIEYSTGKTASKRGYVSNGDLVSFSFSQSQRDCIKTADHYFTYSNFTLPYYCIGNSNATNSIVAYFSEHGFEDAWAADGLELSKIGQDAAAYIKTNQGSIPANWKIYILPCINSRGILEGWTNNGPGRTTVDTCIDINRSFEGGTFGNIGVNNRNFVGSKANDCDESRALQAFLKKVKGESNTMVALDIHGWMGYTIGDRRLGSIFKKQFPSYYNITLTSKANGYSAKWCQDQGMTASLIELPLPGSPSVIEEQNYSGKVAAAILEVTGLELPVISGTMYEYGDNDYMVRVFQAYLKYNGYLDTGVTGSFNSSTKEAVEAYQTKQNIEVDGKIGPETWGMMGFLTDSVTGNVRTDAGAYTIYQPYADYYYDVCNIIPGFIWQKGFYMLQWDKVLNNQNGVAVMSANTSYTDTSAITFKITHSTKGYRIMSSSDGKYLTLNRTTGGVSLQALDDENYDQYWNLKEWNYGYLIQNIHRLGQSVSGGLNVQSGKTIWDIVAITTKNELDEKMGSIGTELKFFPRPSGYERCYLDYTTPVGSYLSSQYSECLPHKYHEDASVSDQAASMDFYLKRANNNSLWDVSVKALWCSLEYFQGLPYIDTFVFRGAVLENGPIYVRNYILGYMGAAMNLGIRTVYWLRRVLISAESKQGTYTEIMQQAVQNVKDGNFSAEDYDLPLEILQPLDEGYNACVSKNNLTISGINGALFDEILDILFPGSGGSTAIDTVCLSYKVLTKEKAAALKTLGYEIVIRTITSDPNRGAAALKRSELEDILDAGLKVVPLYVLSDISKDYFNSITNGITDARYAKYFALSLGFPSGTCIYMDINRINDNPSESSKEWAYLTGIEQEFNSTEGTVYKYGVWGQDKDVAVAAVLHNPAHLIINHIGKDDQEMGLYEECAFIMKRYISSNITGKTMEYFSGISKGTDPGTSKENLLTPLAPGENPGFPENTWNHFQKFLARVLPKFVPNMEYSIDTKIPILLSNAMPGLSIYLVFKRGVKLDTNGVFSISVEKGRYTDEVQASLSAIYDQFASVVLGNVLDGKMNEIAIAIDTGEITINVSYDFFKNSVKYELTAMILQKDFEGES